MMTMEFAVYTSNGPSNGGDIHTGSDTAGEGKVRSVLKEAEDLIYNSREKDYGSPSVSLKKIANLWSAYLGSTLLPKDVAMMMALLKIARLRDLSVPVREGRDSVVDAAGYIGLLERLEER